MKYFISVFTAFIFFFVQINMCFEPVVIAGKFKAKDKYSKYSNAQLLEMAKKDYQTALRMAKKGGLIKNENDFYEILKKGPNLRKPSSKSLKALKKRGLSHLPSSFIGERRYRKLKRYGIDINKVKISGVKKFDTFFKYRSENKKEENFILSFIEGLFNFINSAHAQTLSSTSGLDEYDLDEYEEIFTQPSVADSWDKTKAMQQKSYETHDKEIAHKKLMGYLLITAGAVLVWQGFDQRAKGNKKLEDKCTGGAGLSKIFNLLIPNAYADEKGSKKTKKEIKSQSETERQIQEARANDGTADPKQLKKDTGKKDESGSSAVGTALQYGPQAASLLGGKKGASEKLDELSGALEEGEQEVVDDIRARSAEMEKEAKDQVKKVQKGKPEAKPKDESQNKVSEDSEGVPCYIGGKRNPACDRSCKYKANDEAGNQQVQYGTIMLLAGAALIIWGMSKLGEAASLEDEESEQKKRNQDIEKARQNMLNREEQKKEIQEKIFQYRRDIKLKELNEEEMRRKSLENQGVTR